jgi:hypothetical protein
MRVLAIGVRRDPCVNTDSESKLSVGPFCAKRIADFLTQDMVYEMAQTMSITQALAELKLLDKRIQKALDHVDVGRCQDQVQPAGHREVRPHGARRVPVLHGSGQALRHHQARGRPLQCNDSC